MKYHIKVTSLNGSDGAFEIIASFKNPNCRDHCLDHLSEVYENCEFIGSDD